MRRSRFWTSAVPLLLAFAIVGHCWMPILTAVAAIEPAGHCATENSEPQAPSGHRCIVLGIVLATDASGADARLLLPVAHAAVAWELESPAPVFSSIHTLPAFEPAPCARDLLQQTCILLI